MCCRDTSIIIDNCIKIPKREKRLLFTHTYMWHKHRNLSRTHTVREIKTMIVVSSGNGGKWDDIGENGKRSLQLCSLFSKDLRQI